MNTRAEPRRRVAVAHPSRSVRSSIGFPACLFLGLALLAISPATSRATTLLHTFDNPETGPQSGTHQGYAVAIEGGLTVVGAPFDDTQAQDAGVVRVYDTATGALLKTLYNPAPATGDQFGSSVAVSGNRIVVGAHRDDADRTDSGIAYIYDLTSATPTTPVLTLNNPTPAILDQFGISVAISADRVVVGAHGDETGGNDAGSAYVYDLASATPATPVLTINNPTPAVGDQFGISVAISGTRVLVGALFDDTGANDAGSAYVYDLASATPNVPVVTLNNPHPVGGDQFGVSVALSGSRAVVGVYGDDTGATDAGSAYVYDLAGATPSVPVVTLHNPTPATSDQFGYAVGISGDWVMVGAPFDDSVVTDGGNAYLFDLSSATPETPVKTFANPDAGAGDRLGWAVAISGNRAVAGADLDDRGATDAGSAFVYDLTSPTPLAPTATLSNGSPVPNDHFGAAVAIRGTRMLVGIPLADPGAEDTGSVRLYDLASATPTASVAKFDNPEASTGDQFGIAVGLGTRWAAIGAPFDDSGATDAGSVYVYDLSAATPTVPVAILRNPTPEAGDQFGAALSIDGDRLVIGARFDDTGATDAGSAYVYDLAGATPTIPALTLNNPHPVASDQFGVAVAISGTRVVVGVSGDDTGATDAGSAYVYDLAGATPSVPVLTFNNPAPATGDQFGSAVGIDGARVVIGVPQDDDAANDAGSVYAYDLGGATPTVPTLSLRNPFNAAGDRFGSSVAISGAGVVVGAQFNDSGAGDSGVAYFYNLESTSPLLPVARFSNPTPGGSDQFGHAVAIDGSTVAIGEPLEDLLGVDRGTAYVFTPTEDPDAPSAGTLTLNPPSPSKFGTFIVATFTGWSDATPPITYSLLEGTKVIVSSQSTTTTRFRMTSRGRHTLHVQAVDALGRTTVLPDFEYVSDGTAPVLTVPNSFAVPAESPGGSVINFAVSALDDLDPNPSVVITPPSGSTFPVGTTIVNVTAQDAAGNFTSKSFSISVWVANTPESGVQPDALWQSVDESVAGDQSGMRQGYSVAAGGGLAVVGAPLDDFGATDAGSVRVYDSATGTLRHFLPNPNHVASDQFGTAVAIDGSRVVVGAPFDDTGATDAGSAYVYDLASGNPTVPVAILHNPTPATGDQFGGGVSISGSRVIVGAQFDDTGASNAGSVYVYDLASATPTVPVQTLNNPHPIASDQFGVAVGISGTRAVVGVYGDDTGATDAGSAYAYDLAGATPTTPVATLNNPTPATSDQFGGAVSISGSRVIVGAKLDNTGANDAGSAYVFDLDSATPTVPAVTLNNPHPVTPDQFGVSVAISGTRAVVGVYGDDTGATDAGSAYVFDLASGAPTTPVAVFHNPTPATSDQLGFSVAIDKVTVVVGAPLSDSATTDSGAAYIFAPAAGTPPVAMDDEVARTSGRPLKIPLARLLANDLSALAPPLTVTAVDATSAGGAAVQLVDGVVSYSPPSTFNSPDTFTYTASDGTHTSTATVTVLVNPAPDSLSQNILSTVLGAGGEMRITCAGIPGRNYQLQHAASVVSPVAWSNLGATQPAPPNGRMTFADPAPTSPGFYRVVPAQP